MSFTFEHLPKCLHVAWCVSLVTEEEDCGLTAGLGKLQALPGQR